MATPYSDIYEVFLGKISDYSFLNNTQEEVEENIKSYLKSATVKFRRCKKDLSKRDNSLNFYEENLSDEEKEILGNLMIVEYLTPKLVTSDLLQQQLSSKDFKLYSQANHIKEIRELRTMMKLEADKMIMDYSYFNGDLGRML